MYTRKQTSPGLSWHRSVKDGEHAVKRAPFMILVCCMTSARDWTVSSCCLSSIFNGTAVLAVLLVEGKTVVPRFVRLLLWLHQSTASCRPLEAW